MAKKKSAAAKKMDPVDDRTPRKEPYTPARMNNVIEKIKEQVARMAGLSRGMSDAKIDEIVVDGHAMLLRGLNQIDNFIDNASRAVREARMSRDSL
jgi:hypothetical protein